MFYYSRVSRPAQDYSQQQKDIAAANREHANRPITMKYTKSIVFAVCAISQLFILPLQAQASAKPNIIFILSDDQGYVAHSVQKMAMDHAHAQYQTPHLEKLAEKAHLFTSFYVAPNCAPTRAAFMTGQHSPGAHNQVYNVASLNRGTHNGTARFKGPAMTENLPLEAITLAETLKTNGYHTAHVGKYHVGGNDGKSRPEDQGIDICYGGGKEGSPSQSYFARKKDGSPTFGLQNPGLDPFAADYTEEYVKKYLQPYAQGNDPKSIIGTAKNLIDAEIDACEHFITGHLSDAKYAHKPFYLQWHSYSVHGPLMARRDIAQVAKGDSKRNSTYSGMIMHQDQAIGRLMDFLRDPNRDGDQADSIAENTIVVWTTDNGIPGGFDDSKPLRGQKGNFYEGGVRVPMIISWPAKAPAKTVVHHTPLQHVDLYPTLAELSGTPLPGPDKHRLHGKSFAPLLSAETTGYKPHDIFYYFPGYMDSRARPSATCIAERDGKRYKLIYTWDLAYKPGNSKRGKNVEIKKLNQPWELYNLTADLGEKTNLMEGNKAPAIAGELRDTLNSWLTRDEPQWNPRLMTDAQGDKVAIDLPAINP